ncbi:hypothetical protein AAMO2058_001582400 [Amorphochlora amoebiformis]
MRGYNLQFCCLSLCIVISRGLVINGKSFTLGLKPKESPRTLPKKLIVGYANWCQCDRKIVDAVQDGVNVVIWFNTNLKTQNGKAKIECCTDLKCVAQVARELEDKKLDVIHLMSIGGWNSPHPDPTLNGKTWFQEWHKWNKEVVANESLGFRGFDGLDWDLEGNDDHDSPYNTMTQETLEIMAVMSVEAKKHGYMVGMAPAQSYLNCDTSEFSLSLTNGPAEKWHQDFMYHGRNVYAYLLARCGVETFDFVTLQLYEGWSSANYHLSQKKEVPSNYLRKLIRDMNKGWDVNFPGLGTKRISVPPERLVIGLANGWANSDNDKGKFVFIEPESVEQVFTECDKSAPRPRGFGYWTIGEEGTNGVYLARSLNKFMKIRQC